MTGVQYRTKIFVVLLVAGLTVSCGPDGHNETKTKVADSEASVGIGGDIPDNQQFVVYVNKQYGYQLEIPEGWSRRETTLGVTFTYHFDGVTITVSPNDSNNVSQKPEARIDAQIKSRSNVSDIARSVASIHGSQIAEWNYTTLSAPDTVTGKQVRLDNRTYLFESKSELVELRLWAPIHSDNIDQWKRISESFQWQ